MRAKLIASLWVIVSAALVAGGCIMYSIIAYLCGSPLAPAVPFVGAIQTISLAFWLWRIVGQINEVTVETA